MASHNQQFHEIGAGICHACLFTEIQEWIKPYPTLRELVDRGEWP